MAEALGVSEVCGETPGPWGVQWGQRAVKALGRPQELTAPKASGPGLLPEAGEMVEHAADSYGDNSPIAGERGRALRGLTTVTAEGEARTRRTSSS